MYGNVQIDCHDSTYRYPTHSLEQMFYSDEFKIIACVPTKCGTSTWQQTLASLKTAYIDPENRPRVQRKPKDFRGMEIFKSASRLSHLSYEEAVKRIEDPSFTGVGPETFIARYIDINRWKIYCPTKTACVCS